MKPPARNLATLAVILAAALLWLSSPAGAVTVQTSWGARLTCTADASGYCMVAHPAGVVPDAVTVTPETPAGISVDQLTVATFRVRFYRAISSTGSVTALTGARTFYVHVDWTAGPGPSPSISPSVSPSAPPPGGFPDAGNTGVPAGTVLTVINGDQTISTPGAVLDAMDIRGCVTVTAPGVHITRSRIACAGFETVGYSDRGVQTDRLVVADSEIVCTSGTGGTGVGDTNLTLDRVNIHGCENGVDVDQWVTVQNSWIHGLLGGIGHTDGIQLAHYLDGCTSSTCEINHARSVDVLHNTIEAIDGTSAMISNPSGDENVTVRGNLLTGGAYTLYCPYSGMGSNYQVVDNRFIRTADRPNSGAFGPWTGCEDEAVVTGNVWDDTGQPLPR